MSSASTAIGILVVTKEVFDKIGDLIVFDKIGDLFVEFRTII